MVAQQHAFEALEALLGDSRATSLESWLPYASQLAALPPSASSAVSAVRELAASAAALSPDCDPEAAVHLLLPAVLAALPEQAKAAVDEEQAADQSRPGPALSAAPKSANSLHESAWRGALSSLRILRLRCVPSPLACAVLLSSDAMGLCARVLLQACSSTLSSLELVEEMYVSTSVAGTTDPLTPLMQARWHCIGRLTPRAPQPLFGS
jgi:hypothetical protein